MQKKINYKFTSTPHISRNIGFNPNWSTDHKVSFYLSSDNAEYLNVLHLDICEDYIVWY